ncbi:dihydrofolate reductase family protein [soil metagenome]
MKEEIKLRKLIVSEFVSIDGVMEAPGGEPGYKHSGWVLDFPQDSEQGKYKLDEVLDADALLLGRVTYEGFAAAWPSRRDEAGFADKMNSMPKHVVSSTLDDLAWNNSSLLTGDVAEAVSTLKQQDGGDILVAGSRTLVQTSTSTVLSTSTGSWLFPVVLSSGRRLCPDAAAEKALLKLVDSRTFDSGVAVYTYHPARA